MAHKKQRFVSPLVAEYPPGHWSNTLRVGDAIYVSGMTARANDLQSIQGETAYEQAKVIFTKIKHCIEAAGGTLADMVKMTIYVTNMADNKEIWRARQEFFEGDFPCSTLVQVAGLAKPEILLEIDGIAHAGSGA
ncbi:RidA family protein [Paraburkholderia sp. J63]|uniref:RidA family protein n=1 Tax=Paraburkholderia sp. J63 TaxID=2805434 RepID=UPI002ABDB9FA|nr:RidA family protein [Paraburkholderia sp. J63]